MFGSHGKQVGKYFIVFGYVKKDELENSLLMLYFFQVY